jgi:glycerophosphoryl diester phosphodiesterase
VGAADLGADWVELDARPCVDAVVVHHDAELADGRALVDLTRAELPPAVPSLAAALATCAARGLGVNVEIKALPGEPDHHRCPEVVEAVAAALSDFAGACLVTSFDLACVERVRAVAPDLPVGLLAVVPEGDRVAIEQAADRGCAAINPWAATVDGAFVEAAHAAGLAVYPWTVDEPDELASLLALGVDGLITNTPDLLVRLRRTGDFPP